MSTALVSNNPPKRQNKGSSDSKPDHWVDTAGTSFTNPWPSWRYTTKWERFKLFKEAITWKNPDPKRVETEMPTQTPTWGYDANGAAQEGASDKIKTTWLGHACFLVEFPNRTHPAPGPAAGGEDSKGLNRGLRILFDPVFSNRCSPSQLIGPKRFTPPPCKLEELPDIDAIVISHDHYDHLDVHSIRTLAHGPSSPHIFAPLGNGPFFQSLGIPESRTHIMDWWDSKRLEVKTSADASLAVDITCTPAQHFSGRTFSAYYTTLWASWSVEEVVPPTAAAATPVKLFFGGDTGYRSVMDHQKEDEVPVCPAFKEIGEVFGGFDLALIPIGAYLPRQFMSPIHCAPQDSVRLFKDIQAKKALGMHWGAWVLTSEDILEPPKRLKEECRKLGINEEDFTVCDIGQTLFF
ncbi:N-acyl-phosphatidylethanolamine-hydrolyzing phospholipase D [Coprinopsis cinerea okayama7|uniref:N-acyl-phosphatidylethanolamine-hydrolyzing phospholipase D n=1 Tax=Coprinopsis cinerea (strain Okayama-7 / 130 / ATCC MYA-4618 / FGSC 9003) TaxID=240176 RepID=A8PBD0_COPC7|nr:N-acyl-phosphatidylethanolamine-hydrolyzing phospholipase D [Coprinopsis cinerea okayama7\|eukprot:XP_001840153.1 N-acyl-phosphatidylethanolamine-hydrolyzing phospholipase D [Coprinopsis cinerea okayama7\